MVTTYNMTLFFNFLDLITLALFGYILGSGIDYYINLLQTIKRFRDNTSQLTKDILCHMRSHSSLITAIGLAVVFYLHLESQWILDLKEQIDVPGAITINDRLWVIFEIMVAIIFIMMIQHMKGEDVENIKRIC